MHQVGHRDIFPAARSAAAIGSAHQIAQHRANTTHPLPAIAVALGAPYPRTFRKWWRGMIFKVVDPLLVDEAIVVHSTTGRMWECLRDRRLLASWWPGMELELEVGGSFVERWTNHNAMEQRTTGTVVECVPPSELVLTWIDDDWPVATRVEITIENAGIDSTRIRLRHLRWEALACGAHLVEAHRAGWRHHLANWAKTAESLR